MSQPTTMPHPADFKRLGDDDRLSLALNGAWDDRDWRIDRVAHLVGLDPAHLSHVVEDEHGWEPHDQGFLHKVVETARVLLDCDPLDDIQGHHDWGYEQHGVPLGICRRCGALSAAWEE